MPDPWEVLSSREVHSNPWFSVHQERVRLPNGTEIDDYNVVREPDFVKVCACAPDGRIVFVRDYKHGARATVLELPGGIMNPGEQPLEAAARELLEETGYSGDLRNMAALLANATREPTVEHVFFGRVTLTGVPHLDPAEQAEVVLVPPARVRRLIEDGEILPMSTVAAVLLCLPLITWSS